MRRFGFLYRIEAYLKEVAIAFSGGVDSAYLLYEAKKYAKRAKEAGLFTWDKPAYACLTTRIPTGELITKEKLEATHGNGI